MSLSLSPFSDSDRSEVLALWRGALPLDAVTADIFEKRVLLDENFDPQTFLLARENGTLRGFVIGTYAKRIGLGDADPDGVRGWITLLAVSPSANVMSVGSALVEAVEQRLTLLGKKECYVSNYPPGYFTPGIDKKAYPHLIDFFSAVGYEPFHEAISMDAAIVLFRLSDEIVNLEEKLLQEGIVIRHYDRNDLLSFITFLEQSMPTDWVRVERDNLKKLSGGGFKEDQITVVARAKEIVGYCQFEGSHFGPFGVRSDCQGRGIGTVLLARTLERMRQLGYHDAWVLWTDDVAARVYKKFGFVETRRFVLFRKKI